MKIYTVENQESGYRDEFTSLTEAKKAMREHDAQGFIAKVWAKKMHDGKKEIPEMWRVVLALLVFGDVPPLPLTGFIAETTDTHEKYFHAFSKIGYSTDLIAKWDYETAPGYCLRQTNPKED